MSLACLAGTRYNQGFRLSESSGESPALTSSLRIRTNSRLAFGLLDLNGEIGRIEGGLGLALESPSVELCARRADGLAVSGVEPVPESVRRKFETMHTVFAERHHTGGIAVRIEKTIPTHCGLGSGTQLALAFGQARNLLYDLALSPYEVSLVAERGGTSGIGCAAFEMGGFLADGGHRFRCAGGKSAFAPSSASTAFAPAPILFQAPLPRAWSVVLATPRLAGRRTATRSGSCSARSARFPPWRRRRPRGSRS